MTDYLKQAPWHSKAVSADVRRTVSEMLSRIDADPETEIRRYSKELDDWEPESFLVDAATIERAAEQLDEPLREHISFAQTQVRTFAQAQRDTLTDLEVETLPGVVLGHRQLRDRGSVGVVRSRVGIGRRSHRDRRGDRLPRRAAE